MIKFWGVEEVGNWLESLGLAEYKERFAKNDIQGEELLGLDRNDLKVCIHIRCQYIDAPLVLGEYTWEFLVRVCRPVLQDLTQFQTKKCHF